MNKQKIETILNSLSDEQKNWFTTPIQGNIKRYIVWLTNNQNIFNADLPQLLEKQLKDFSTIYYQLNIGGWLDWTILYIDVSTSFSDLEEAFYIARQYKQIAIWDNIDWKEIRL